MEEIRDVEHRSIEQFILSEEATRWGAFRWIMYLESERCATFLPFIVNATDRFSLGDVRKGGSDRYSREAQKAVDEVREIKGARIVSVRINHFDASTSCYGATLQMRVGRDVLRYLPMSVIASLEIAIAKKIKIEATRRVITKVFKSPFMKEVADFLYWNRMLESAKEPHG